MKNCKEVARKISSAALDIAASVENTVVVARQSGEVTNNNISITAALKATRECALQSVIIRRSMTA